MTDFCQITFRDLLEGEEFRFSLNAETGLLADLDKPGRVQYTKFSARRWHSDKGTIGRVGSINTKVWVER